MKRLSILLTLLIAWCFGCTEHDQAISTSSSSYDYRVADSLFRLGNDLAFYYYNRVANNATDSLQRAGAYNRMALMQFNSGDHFGSQETVTESLKFLDEKIVSHHPYLLPNYNLLGRSNLEQGNYDAAVTHFRQAETFLQKGQSNITLLNNIAVAYQKKEEYRKAVAILQPIADTCKDTLAYARVLSNLARTKWLVNPAYNAVPEFLTALKFREIKNDKIGLTASYSHLSEYYANKHPDSSLLYANKMYEVAQNPNDKLEALKKMINTEPPKYIKDHFIIFHEINDSLQQAHNKSKNQFALIRFDTEKNKSENLRLQRDNIKQRSYSVIAIVGAILLIGMGIVLYWKRKRKIKWEAQNAIRENQLKTSRKVHDVVANGLYRIMTNLEHTNSIEKEPLLDEIESLYEQSRDISYDQPIHQAGDYSAKIHRLLSSFGTADTKVLIAGNQEMTWNKLSTHEKEELEYVLQEFMVNMSKHSQARNVVVRFAEEANRFTIHYKDDGVGLTPTFQFGNGLRNTENRIKNLGGTITFDGMTGLKIEISLPTGTAND